MTEIVQAHGLFSSLRKDPYHREAVHALRQLHRDIDDFHRVRLLNEMALRGTDPTCRYKPAEIRQRLEMFRDPEMERRFGREVVELLTIIYGRTPTTEELRAGIPTDGGLSGGPSLYGIASAVAGAAWGLHSITKYLAERERMVRGAEEGPGTLRKLGKGAMVLGAVGLSSYAAYRGFNWLKGWWGKRKPVEEPEEPEEFEEPREFEEPEEPEEFEEPEEPEEPEEFEEPEEPTDLDEEEES